jgi:chromosome segregation ATPase
MSTQAKVVFEGDGLTHHIRAVAILDLDPGAGLACGEVRIDSAWSRTSEGALGSLVEILAEKHQVTLNGFRAGGAEVRGLRGELGAVRHDAQRYLEERDDLQGQVESLQEDVHRLERQYRDLIRENERAQRTQMNHNAEEDTFRAQKTEVAEILDKAIADLARYASDVRS